jgi:uncharacterized protein YijF (DUF1287 family)
LLLVAMVTLPFIAFLIFVLVFIGEFLLRIIPLIVHNLGRWSAVICLVFRYRLFHFRLIVRDR